jgi:hypothetical protein
MENYNFYNFLINIWRSTQTVQMQEVLYTATLQVTFQTARCPNPDHYNVNFHRHLKTSNLNLALQFHRKSNSFT